MIGGLLPVIIAGFASAAAGAAGDIAARNLWEQLSKDPKQQELLPKLYVRWLQVSLNLLGHSVDVDGVYGEATTNAVRIFQAANGLTVDGLAGIFTIDAIVVKLTRLPRGSEWQKASKSE